MSVLNVNTEKKHSSDVRYVHISRHSKTVPNDVRHVDITVEVGRVTAGVPLVTV
jgi:hypothetical protein